MKSTTYMHIASTKFHTRPLRTVVTIVVSGLMFATLLSSLTVVTSVLNSIDSMSGAIFGGSYYVRADRNIDISPLTEDPSMVSKAERLFSTEMKRREQIAKVVGYSFDKSSMQNPILTDASGKKSLDMQSELSQQVIKEYYSNKSHTEPDEDTLKSISLPYGGQDITKLEQLRSKEGLIKVYGSHGSQLNTGSSQLFSEIYPYVVDDPLLSPFIEKSVQVGEREVPILLPESIARDIFSMSRPSKKASISERLDNFNILNREVVGKSFEGCFRNRVSQHIVGQLSIEPSDYSSPQIYYKYQGAESCTEPVVEKDNRTAVQIHQDSLQNRYLQEIGQPFLPMQQKIVFRIVGLLPSDMSTNMQPGEVSLLAFLGNSGLSMPLVPHSAISKNVVKNFFQVSPGQFSQFPYTHQYVVRFDDSNKLTKFLEERSCDPGQLYCTDTTRPFLLQEMGSSGAAVNNLRVTAQRIAMPLYIFFGVIAVIIMGNMFARIIDDNRREIAIYRAIGASNRAIGSIYLIYSILLSLSVLIFVLLLTVGLCSYLNVVMAPELSMVANARIFGRITSHQVSLMMLDAMTIIIVIGLILLAGLLGMSFVLPSALKRPVITDIRDE